MRSKGFLSKLRVAPEEEKNTSVHSTRAMHWLQWLLSHENKPKKLRSIGLSCGIQKIWTAILLIGVHKFCHAWQGFILLIGSTEFHASRSFCHAALALFQCLLGSRYTRFSILIYPNNTQCSAPEAANHGHSTRADMDVVGATITTIIDRFDICCR